MLIMTQTPKLKEIMAHNQATIYCNKRIQLALSKPDSMLMDVYHLLKVHNISTELFRDSDILTEAVYKKIKQLARDKSNLDVLSKVAGDSSVVINQVLSNMRELRTIDYIEKLMGLVE